MKTNVVGAEREILQSQSVFEPQGQYLLRASMADSGIVPAKAKSVTAKWKISRFRGVRTCKMRKIWSISSAIFIILSMPIVANWQSFVFDNAKHIRSGDFQLFLFWASTKSLGLFFYGPHEALSPFIWVYSALYWSLPSDLLCLKKGLQKFKVANKEL